MPERPQPDPGLGDIHEMTEWYCCRCERQRMIARRLNATGITLFGALGALGLPWWIKVVPALATELGSEGAAWVVSVAYVGIVASLLISEMRKGGPARTIICAACEGTDVVPLDSPKAQRALAGAHEAA